MKFPFTILILVLIAFQLGCKPEESDSLRLVAPMIGTDGTGHTLPGATTPFGMIQLSPSNDFKGWAWCSGYHYSDSILKGFAHNHISGAGLSGLGDILLMPTIGDVQLSSGNEENPEKGYRSRFSHESEIVSPGYYRVLLDDYNIVVELTASSRVGFHRYTFPERSEGNVIIDPTHGLDESITETQVEFVSNTELQGYKRSVGDDGSNTVYFYAEFSEPFVRRGVAIDEQVDETRQKATSENVKAFVQFNVEKAKDV